MAKSLIRTSGWNYKHWHRCEFYPTELKPPQWLPFFSQQFQTVEIISSFYRLPSDAAFQHWRTQVPRDFIFGVKATHSLTRIKRLKDPKDPPALFLSRAKHLEDRLGPVLFQLPPQFNLNLDRDVESVREWLKSGLDVYMYFNNDVGGHAIRNAKYVFSKLCE